MNKYRIHFNGQIYEMEIEKIEEQKSRKVPMGNIQVVPPVIHKDRPALKEGVVISAMPGMVMKIMCEVGQMVKSGQVLMIIEAMKMENEITSNRDGIVKKILVEEGRTVSSGDTLVEIE